MKFHHTVHDKVNANQISIFDEIKKQYPKLPNLFGYAGEESVIANFKPEGKTSIKDIVVANGSYNETETDDQTFDLTKKTLVNKPLFSFFYYVNPDLAGHSRE